MNSIQIIQAEKENLESIALLFNQYMIFYDQPSNKSVYKAYLKERMQNKETVIFLALDNAKLPLGFVLNYYSFSSVSLGRTIILNDLYVDQNHRNKGIGEQLIKRVFDFAKNTNALRVDLETGIDNKTAQGLYERIGFKKDKNALLYSYSETVAKG